jgi:hypothetical protein
MIGWLPSEPGVLVRHCFRVLSMAALFLLSACANAPPPVKLDADSSNGLVVGSISYESGIASFFLLAENTNTGQRVEFRFGCPSYPCSTPWKDARFSTGETARQRGGGYAVAVPAGEYRIASWRAQQGGTGYHSTQPIDIPFKVEKGQVSYLGNLHFDEYWVDVQLRDRSARDLPALRESHPTIASAPMAFTIGEGTDLHELGVPYRTDEPARSHPSVFDTLLPFLLR